jgi:hypothetical protein
VEGGIEGGMAMEGGKSRERGRRGQHCTRREKARERGRRGQHCTRREKARERGRRGQHCTRRMGKSKRVMMMTTTLMRGQKRDHDRHVAGATGCDVLGSIQKGNILSVSDRCHGRRAVNLMNGDDVR